MFVVSLGGSLICPDEIDTEFLSAFRELILSYAQKGERFILICGGGKVARQYQEAASRISQLSDEEMDWLGIAATKINAQLMHAVFPKEQLHAKIIDDPSQKITSDRNIIICSGWKPGRSTDYDAVLLAKQFRAKVINLTNIDEVYDKDPRKFKDAKPLKSLAWKDFRKLVGSEWKPGMNAPFDPVAAREAEASRITVIVAGKDLANLKNILDGKEFKGTLIQ